jgi:hypothetical protein
LQRLAGNRAVSAAIKALAVQRASSSASSRSGGGGGGGGGGAATSPGPRVEVGSTHIGGVLAGAPIWHLFLIYTDAAGVQQGYRGGPGGPGGPPGSSFGTIQTNRGTYDSSFIDYPSLNTVTIATGATAAGKDVTFASELSRINGTATAYSPTGPNSNTVASTLLHAAGLVHNKPVLIAPGFDDPDI